MDKKTLKKITIRKLAETNIIAWESLLSKLLSFRSRSYCLKDNISTSTIRNKCSAFSQFEYKYGYLAKEETLVGRFTKDKQDINKVSQLLKDAYQYIKDPKLCDLTIAEILTKVLAYRNLTSNMEFEIPILKNGEMELKKYKVDKVFNLWNSMKAFGLKAVEEGEPPILIFRGTEFSITNPSGRTSIVSNFDPEGPGKSVYSHARPMIQKWLKKVCKNGVQARAMGYSLGGALTSYAVISDPEFFSKKQLEPSYAFHHPGVSEVLYKKWLAMPDSEKPSFEGYVAEGDFVSKYGKLFSKTYEIIAKEQLPPIESHTSLFFTRALCYLAEIDLDKENGSESRHSYSKFHEKTSSLIYHAGIKFLLPTEEKDFTDHKNESS
ncbi:MAG: hypothetical protein HY860_06430 [Chlamydiales bacterium]|nr:hypothetical protein [Chlamydiales bacterium]